MTCNGQNRHDLARPKVTKNSTKAAKPDVTSVSSHYVISIRTICILCRV